MADADRALSTVEYYCRQFESVDSFNSLSSSEQSLMIDLAHWILGNDNLESDKAAQFNEYLKSFVEFTFRALDSSSIDIDYALCRPFLGAAIQILGEKDEKFYIHQQQLEDAELQETGSVETAGEAELPFMYRQNVEFFFEIGGLQSFMKFFDACHTDIPPEDIAAIFKALFQACIIAEPSLIETVADRLHQYICTEIPDEAFYRSDINYIQDLVQVLQSSMIPLRSRPEIEEKRMCYALDIGLRLLRSSMLEKKLAGISMIKANIPSSKSQNVSFIEEAFGQWVHDASFLACIFGSSLHLSVVQRVGDILEALLSSMQLTTEDLQIIWDSVQRPNQHSSVKQVVMKLLAQNINLFTIELACELLGMLEKYPMAEFDANAIDIIDALLLMFQTDQEFASYLRRRVREDDCVELMTRPFANDPLLLPYRFILIFWEAGKDDSPSSANIKTRAIGSLQRNLEQPALFPVCFKLFVPIIEMNLKEHSSVPAALQVLQKIFDVFDRNPSLFEQTAPIPLDSFFDYLLDEMGILQLILDDWKYYKSKAQGSVGKHPAGDSAVLYGEYPHLVQIQCRLDALLFMHQLTERYPYMEARMSRPQLFSIWKTGVIEALTSKEREITMRFLANFRTTAGFCEELLDRHVDDLSLKTFTETDSAALLDFFLSANANTGKLIIDPQSGIYEVNTMELIGLDFLWKLAISLEPIEVASPAIDTLIQIHLSLHEDSSANIYEERRGCRNRFISNCFAQLRSGNVIRSVELLTRFVDYFTRLYPQLTAKQGFIRPFGCDYGPRIKISVTANGYASPTQLEIPQQATIEDLHLLIINHLNLDPDRRVRIFTRGKELETTSAMLGRSLEQVQIENGENVMISVVAAMSPELDRDGQSTGDVSDASWVVPDIAKEEDLPSNVLAQTPNFSILYEFLNDTRLDIAECVWKLLWKIPGNIERIKELEKLCLTSDDGSFWRKNFNPAHPYLTLYNSRILNALLKQHGVSGLISSGSSVLSGIGQDFANYNPEFLKRSPADIECFIEFSVLIHSFMSVEHPEQIPMDFAGIAEKICSIICNTSQLLPTLRGADIIASHLLNLLFFGGSRLAIIKETVLQPSHLHKFIWNVLIPESSIRSPDGLRFYDCIFHCISGYLSSSLASQSARLEAVELFNLMTTAIIQASWENVNKRLIRAGDYFKIVQQVSVIVEEEDSLIPWTTLVEKLVIKIINYPLSEQSDSLDHVDSYLSGLFILSARIIEKRPVLAKGRSKLLHSLFQDFLFQTGNLSAVDGGNGSPKCRTSTSRTSCFELLKSLVWNDAENYGTFLSLLLSQQNRDNEPFNTWMYSPSSESKTACGYVGLRNLGTTCYMNSILQQFFMIPSFRKSVFNARENNQKDISDNLLYQLQRMFGFLQESQRRAFDTTLFAHACKDYEGNPTDTSMQMDVDEFFNLLFDRLENQLKSTGDEKIFKEHFGGALVHQIKSKECEHVSEREESFFAVQCEVKNWKDLESSLQGYIQGEMLEGDNKYQCSTCQTLVNAVKRACIKTLPRHLILTLKRFDFDFETMRRIKINKRFEFPNQINMEPFTADFIQQHESSNQLDKNTDGVNYRLGGILVHTGTADSGHYYSFVKERPMDEADKTSTPRWYHFNDSSVEYFEESEIPFQCFGGATDAPPNSRKSSLGGRHFNAYILVYDREGTLADSSPADHPKLDDIPAEIQKEVALDNSSFLHDRHLFDGDYLLFIQSFLEKALAQKATIAPADFLRTIQLGTRFFLHTLVHSKDFGLMHSCCLVLKQMVSTCPQSQPWFLDYLTNDRYCMKQILFDCYAEESRKEFASLVIGVVTAFRERSSSSENSNEDSYGINSLYNGIESSVKVVRSADNQESEIRCGPSMVRFLEVLLSYLPEIEQHWRNFDQYWALLWQITILGPHERRFMIKKGICRRLFDFFLEVESPIAPTTRKKMGDRFNTPNLDDFYRLLAEIICQHDVNRSVHAPSGAGMNGVAEAEDLLLFSAKDLDILRAADKNQDLLFFGRLIRQCGDFDMAAKILQHFCRENMDIGQAVIGFANRMMSQGKDSPKNSFARALKSLVVLDDSLSSNRRAFILDQVIKSSGRQPSVGSVLILHELHKIDKSMARLLIDCVGGWLIFAILSADASIRETAEMIITNIVGDLTTNRKSNVDSMDVCDSEVDVESILRCLLDAVDVVRNFADKSHYGRLVQYFSAIRCCMVSQPTINLVGKFFNPLMILLSSVESRNLTRDEDKKQITLLLHKLLVAREDLIMEICKNQSFGMIFSEYTQDVDPEKQESIDFNNLTLTALYDILLLCMRQSELFMEKLRASNAINWALEYICFRTDVYDKACEKLMEIFTKLITSKPYRTKKISAISELLGKNELRIGHTKFIQLIELLMQDEEDALRLLSPKILRRFNRMFAINNASSMEQKQAALESLLRLSTHLLSPSAKAMLEWPKAVEASQEIALQLCLSILLTFNFNHPPALVSLASDVIQSLLDIFPGCIDPVFESIYGSQLEILRISKNRSAAYFDLFRGQYSPFTDTSSQATVNYRPASAAKFTGFHLDSTESWEGLPAEIRLNAKDEFYAPFYRLVCFCCENASPKFSIESWHLVCTLAAEALILDDLQCAKSFLRITKERDQLLDISSPDFEVKMKMLRQSVFDFLQTLFSHYPMKLTMPMYGELVQFTLELIFNQEEPMEDALEFFNEHSTISIDKISKFRQHLLEYAPIMNIWVVIRLAQSTCTMAKLEKSKQLQTLLQEMKDESSATFDELLEGADPDQRHAIEIAIRK